MNSGKIGNPIPVRTYFAVAVTDVHLGYGKSESAKFEAFVDDFFSNNSVEHFVIMGDFLDFWTKDNDRLIEKYDRLLQKLSRLKEERKIGVLNYVIGNHDFIVEELQEKHPILGIFDFKSPVSGAADWLTLETPKQEDPHPKTYGFLHGHQLIEGNAGEIYDGICRYLCDQGDFRGWLSRVLWDGRYLIPLISTVAALVLLAISLYIPAFVAAVIAVASFVWLYRKKPDLSDISAESHAEKVKVVIGSLPWRKRRAIRKHFKRAPDKRRIFRDVAEIDRETMQQAYQAVEPVVGEFDVDETLKSLDQVLQTRPDDSAYVTLIRKDHTVVGHTHEEDRESNYTNLGSWEKGRRHWYLTISETGEPKPEEW
ncbi:MAG: metallophosphoesterase [Candidatus Thorarchaeota archaeon]|jgi:UDP-2,3-diacylglucosamine pyrophosphatase LpxH